MATRCACPRDTGNAGGSEIAYLISFAVGSRTNQTPPEPWPLTSPGAPSPAKRYSGHLPALSWCVPSARSTTREDAGVEAGRELGAVDDDRRPRLGAVALAGRRAVGVLGEAVERHARRRRPCTSPSVGRGDRRRGRGGGSAGAGGAVVSVRVGVRRTASRGRRRRRRRRPPAPRLGDQRAVEVHREPHVARALAGGVAGSGVAAVGVQRELAGDELQACRPRARSSRRRRCRGRGRPSSPRRR